MALFSNSTQPIKLHSFFFFVSLYMLLYIEAPTFFNFFLSCIWDVYMAQNYITVQPITLPEHCPYFMLSFTSGTATWRTNLPAGFITVMNDCSLVWDALWKVEHDEPFSFIKGLYDRLMNVTFEAFSWSFYSSHEQQYFSNVLSYLLEFKFYDSRLVQPFSSAYRWCMPRQSMEVYSACM